MERMQRLPRSCTHLKRIFGPSSCPPFLLVSKEVRCQARDCLPEGQTYAVSMWEVHNQYPGDLIDEHARYSCDSSIGDLWVFMMG